MDTSLGILTVTGDMQSEISSIVWSNSSKGTDNILTIKPTSSWRLGQNRTLNIAAADIAGNSVAANQFVYTILKSVALNDTGFIHCGDYASDIANPVHNNDVNCELAGATTTIEGKDPSNSWDIVPAGQDAHYGRDATHNDKTGMRVSVIRS